MVQKTLNMFDIQWRHWRRRRRYWRHRRYRRHWRHAKFPWHWRVMQSLKKSWPAVSNMTWGILVNFHPSNQKSKNFTSMGYFCPKYMRFDVKKIPRGFLSWHWTVMQNLNKPWPCGFKNGMRNWVSFIIAPNSISWHWRVM